MTRTTDMLWLSIRELADGIRTRRFSPVELAETYMARLEAHGPALGALVTVTRERALEEARRAERELAAGKYRGPLHGIPYGVKDLLATTGYDTTWGATPYRNQRFEFDATVVARLRDAGAVLVAKLAMVELAGGMGYNRRTPASPARAVRRGTPRTGRVDPRAVRAPPSERDWCRSRSAARRGGRSCSRRPAVP